MGKLAILNTLHVGYFLYFLFIIISGAWIPYGIVEFNVPLDIVETGALSSDVHLSFSNGGPAT